MRKPIAVSLVVLLCASILAPQRITTPGKATEVSMLLDESYSLSNREDFGEIERIWYLGDLLNICVTLAPERAPKLSDELFSLSRNSQALQNFKAYRIANEKNAFVLLSRVDPERAMQRFPEVEDPDPVMAPEDVRAHAARTIFSNYFERKGLDALSEIRHQAKHIGDTGVYPYHALGLVLSKLGESQDDTARSIANEIFNEILPYYDRGSLISNEDSEFFALLQNARFAIDASLLKRGIQALSSHVTQKLATEKSVSRDEIFIAKVLTEKGEVILKSKNLTLLFRAFPLISEVDSALAGRLVTTYHVLGQANAKLQNIASTIVKAGLPQEEIIKLETQGLQESLLAKIQDLEQTDPKLALRLAETLPKDSVIRMVGISSALSGLTQADPQQTKDIYAREFIDPASIPDEQAKLRVMAACVKAAYYAQDVDNFNYFTAQAVEKGANLYEKSVSENNRLPADARPGYVELTRVVEFGMAHNLSWLLDQSKQAQGPVLKAHLLMYAAKGAFRRTRS